MVELTPDIAKALDEPTEFTDAALLTPDKLTVLDDEGVIVPTEVVLVTPDKNTGGVTLPTEVVEVTPDTPTSVKAAIAPVWPVLVTPLKPTEILGVTLPTEVVELTPDSAAATV